MLFFKTNKVNTSATSNIVLFLIGLNFIVLIWSSCTFAVPLSEDGESEKIEIKKKSSGKLKKPRGKFTKIPKVAVFQADGVFWPYKVERDVEGPFAVHRTDVLPKQMEEYEMKTPLNTKIIQTYQCEHEIVDNKGKSIKTYDGIKGILEAVKKKGSKLALIETTTEGATLLHLVTLCGFDLFKFKEVDDDPEIDHIRRIQTQAEVEFKDMTYFGANETSLKEINKLGVTTVQIHGGLKMEHIMRGEQIYAKAHQI
uniref:Uncharacterized protein n=1 Tax=Clastoptera arizonana TaxID=38151 RepID=A0A1B6D555_9HEMI